MKKIIFFVVIISLTVCQAIWHPMIWKKAPVVQPTVQVQATVSTPVIKEVSKTKTKTKIVKVQDTKIQNKIVETFPIVNAPSQNLVNVIKQPVIIDVGLSSTKFNLPVVFENKSDHVITITEIDFNLVTFADNSGNVKINISKESVVGNGIEIKVGNDVRYILPSAIVLSPFETSTYYINVLGFSPSFNLKFNDFVFDGNVKFNF